MFGFARGKVEHCRVVTIPRVFEFNGEHVYLVMHYARSRNAPAIWDCHSKNSPLHTPEFHSLVPGTHGQKRRTGDVVGTRVPCEGKPSRVDGEGALLMRLRLGEAVSVFDPRSFP